MIADLHIMKVFPQTKVNFAQLSTASSGFKSRGFRLSAAMEVKLYRKTVDFLLDSCKLGEAIRSCCLRGGHPRGRRGAAEGPAP